MFDCPTGAIRLGYCTRLNYADSHLSRDTAQGLTVRPEPVEGWVVKPIVVRQAHHERLNLKLSRLKWVANYALRVDFFLPISKNLSYFTSKIKI
jgi:hypothetical protein